MALFAQLTEHSATQLLIWAANTQSETAGLTILHQQYLFSLAVDDTVSVSDGSSVLPDWFEQNATPFISTLVPPVVHDTPQSAECDAAGLVHVVLELSFTHFVAAWAAVIVVVAHSANNRDDNVFIVSPSFGFLAK